MIKMNRRKTRYWHGFGNRLSRNVEKEALRGVFHVGNRLLALAHRMLNGVSLEDPLTGLRVIRAAALRGWLAKSRGFDIEVEINYLIKQRCFKIKEIPICYRARLGEKKLKVRYRFTILKRILLGNHFTAC